MYSLIIEYSNEIEGQGGSSGVCVFVHSAASSEGKHKVQDGATLNLVVCCSLVVIPSQKDKREGCHCLVSDTLYRLQPVPTAPHNNYVYLYPALYLENSSGGGRRLRLQETRRGWRTIYISLTKFPRGQMPPPPWK